MKNTLALLLCAALLLLSSLPAAQAAVTDAKTPYAAAEEAQFIKKMGMNYRTAPTPPTYADGALYTVSGDRIFRLDAVTGETLQSAALAGRTMYTVVPVTAADGVLYVPLDDGLVQALDAKTLTQLWLYRDPLGGQALCPVISDGAFLYTAFWNGEADEANCVCLTAADDAPGRTDEEKSAVWTFASVGGFYRAAACVYGDWLIFGCDDGVRGSGGVSRVTAVDKRTGNAVSTLETVGDLRTAVVYSPETDAFYTCSKAGYIYKFSCDPATGKLSGLLAFAAPGGVTAVPAVYGGRLYAGCQDGAAGSLLVLDAATLVPIYTAALPGYPQAEILLSTGYAGDGGQVFLYGTCNRTPGGIWMLTDAPGQTSGTAEMLFTPPEDAAQYCISPIAVGPDGTLYYKNDSGNLFAVKGCAEEYGFAVRLLERLRTFLTAVSEAVSRFRTALCKI